MNDTINFYWTIERDCVLHKEEVFEILYDVIITYKEDDSDIIEWLKDWLEDNLESFIEEYLSISYTDGDVTKNNINDIIFEDNFIKEFRKYYENTINS